MTNDESDLRARLRAATAGCHQRLEAGLDLLAEPCEQARFVALLLRFRSFHAAWEPALARCLPGDAAMLAARSKLALIDADLRALGVGPGTTASSPDASFAAALCADPPSALGSLYVLEGSTLGGKFISRHLAHAAADWLPAAGLRYFDPYGDATGARWKDTLARLAAASAADHAGIAQGAVRTFDALHDWLMPGAAAPAAIPAATPAASVA